MKKIIILLAIFCIILCSCNSENKNVDEEPVFESSDNQNSSQISNQNIIIDYLPEPFGEGVGGGDELLPFYEQCNILVSSIPYDLIEQIGIEKYEEWYEHMNDNDITTDIRKGVNLFSLIQDFNIDRELVRENLYFSMKLWDKHGIVPNYTPELIDIILEDDAYKFAETFVSELSIFCDGKIYTPEWLYYRSIEEWEENNISPDIINEKASKIIENIPFTEKAREYLIRKFEKYTKSVIEICDDPVYTSENNNIVYVSDFIEEYIPSDEDTEIVIE